VGKIRRQLHAKKDLMRTPPDKAELRHCFGPRFWPIWLVLGLLWIGCHLPYGMQLALGRRLGRLLHRFAGDRRRQVVARNLKLCFPDRNPEELAELMYGQFEALGIAFFEIGMCWWGSARRLRKLVTVDGLENLEQARARGHGVLLLSGHFTTLEIGGRLLGLFSPFHLMYRPNRNPLIQWVMRRSRERHFERAIARNDVRSMLKSLKEGFPVWYAPDQAYRGMQGAMVPFFNVPAPTITATSRIAHISGAPVVPFFCERLPGKQGYRLRLLPALENFPTDDPVADATRVNHVIEEQVRRVPEQYMWVHDRFKEVPRRPTRRRNPVEGSD
jgi:KDO2-lipid IV(A) lauroyltransferase